MIEDQLEKLRSEGWAIAAHYDRTDDGRVVGTCYLLKRDGRCVEACGATDAEALTKIQQQLDGAVPQSTPAPAGGEAWQRWVEQEIARLGETDGLTQQRMNQLQMVPTGGR